MAVGQDDRIKDVNLGHVSPGRVEAGHMSASGGVEHDSVLGDGLEEVRIADRCRLH